MRWCARLQRLEEKTKPRPRRLTIDAKEGEHTRLQVRIAYSDAATAELGAIEHHVVCKRAHAFGGRFQKGHVFWVRCSEGMMHRREHTGRRVTIEQWEVGDPDQRIRAGGDETLTRGNVLTNAVERGVCDTVGACSKQSEIALGNAEG